MDDIYFFQPPRRLGLAFHGIVIAIFLGISGLGFYLAVRSVDSMVFIIFLVPALVSLSIVPVLGYRAYALRRAYYTLEREGVRLRWGLRVEDIPMDAVAWVRLPRDWGYRLPRPWPYWPGAVLGTRWLPDDVRVEYLAANTSQLVLIAAAGSIFAISPSDPDSFLRTFQYFAELGSLSPLPAQSVYPAMLLTRVWAARPARFLLLAGAALSLLLLILVGLALPFRTTVSLGFQADGSPRDLVPSVQLLLLPVLNTAFFTANLLLGLLFFRRGEVRDAGVGVGANLQNGTPVVVGADIGEYLAYLLWGSGVITALLFLGAYFFIT